jgi:RNA polymerase sigma-70 factor (ECF subfamily)
METIVSGIQKDFVASLYKRYGAELKQYLLSYTHDMMAAEDMLQDLFLKLLSVDVLAPETANRLIFVMAKRMIIDDARHKSFVNARERELSSQMSYYENSSLERRIEARQLLSLARRHLDTMAPKRAEVYSLYRLEGYSASDIANRLNLSRRTVETHIYQATKDMRQYLRMTV